MELISRIIAETILSGEKTAPRQIEEDQRLILAICDWIPIY